MTTAAELKKLKKKKDKELKAKNREANEKTVKKIKGLFDTSAAQKFAKKAYDKLDKKLTISAEKRKLQENLKSEEHLATSRALKGGGREGAANLHLGYAVNAKDREEKLQTSIDKRKLNKQRRDEGWSANEIFIGKRKESGVDKAVDNSNKAKSPASIDTGSSIYNKTKKNIETAYKGKTSMHDIDGGKFGHTAKKVPEETVKKFPGDKGVTHGPAVGPSHLTDDINKNKKKSSSKTTRKHASQTQMKAARRSMGIDK